MTTGFQPKSATELSPEPPAPLAMTPLVAVEGISKSYAHAPALAPLSFPVFPGERVAVAGPSGSGKTTLLYLLAGILQPDFGRLFIDGQPLARLRPGRDLARLVGIVHQQYDLVPHLTVLHNVLAGWLGQWVCCAP